MHSYHKDINEGKLKFLFEVSYLLETDPDSLGRDGKTGNRCDPAALGAPAGDGIQMYISYQISYHIFYSQISLIRRMKD
jgi:hypothetical protein